VVALVSACGTHPDAAPVPGPVDAHVVVVAVIVEQMVSPHSACSTSPVSAPVH
jgi:hypothetical protein